MSVYSTPGSRQGHLEPPWATRGSGREEGSPQESRGQCARRPEPAEHGSGLLPTGIDATERRRAGAAENSAERQNEPLNGTPAQNERTNELQRGTTVNTPYDMNYPRASPSQNASANGASCTYPGANSTLLSTSTTPPAPQQHAASAPSGPMTLRPLPEHPGHHEQDMSKSSRLQQPRTPTTFQSIIQSFQHTISYYCSFDGAAQTAFIASVAIPIGRKILTSNLAQSMGHQMGHAVALLSSVAMPGILGACNLMSCNPLATVQTVLGFYCAVRHFAPSTAPQEPATRAPPAGQTLSCRDYLMSPAVPRHLFPDEPIAPQEPAALPPMDFWSQPSKKEHKAPLTSDEIKQHKSMLEPASADQEMTAWLAFLKTRHPQAAALLSLSYDDASACISAYPTAYEANAWLATAILATLDVDSTKCSLFRARLFQDEKSQPGIASSGIDINERIKSGFSSRETSEKEKDWNSFESKAFLMIGMSPDEVRLAVHQIERCMDIMPEYRRLAPHATLRAIISKLPAEIADQRSKYLRALDRAENLKETPTLESKPLDVARLAEWIAVDISAYESPTDKQKEVSTSELQQRADRIRKHHKPPCTNCGGDHVWVDCTRPPCSDCGQAPCQGTRGKPCWVHMDELPEYKDANGAPLNPKLVVRFDRLREKNAKPVKEVSSLEISALETQTRFSPFSLAGFTNFTGVMNYMNPVDGEHGELCSQCSESDNEE